MTKKDYELIAKSLHTIRREVEYHNNSSFTLARIAEVLTNALQADNPRFDRARFLKACGV